MKHFLFTTLCVTSLSALAVGPVPGQGTWTQTLHARNTQGQAVALDSPAAVFLYDSVLNVTWLRNAAEQGPVDHGQALAWADGLVIGAFSDWRLPRTLDTGAPGCPDAVSYSGGDCGFNVLTQGPGGHSELAHLFHVTLGNQSSRTPDGVFRGYANQGVTWGLVNTGAFYGLQPMGTYWSGTHINPWSIQAFMFSMYGGSQHVLYVNQPLSGLLAVRDGDVLSAVPEPASGLLLLAGLGGVLARRQVQRAA